MRYLSLCGLLALSCIPVATPASPDAETLFAEYEKRDVIKMLLHQCAGDVTINKPFPRRVLGRPPAAQVDARTLAHDMKRCGFTAADARAYFERTAVPPSGKSVGFSSGRDSAATGSSAPPAASSNSQRQREREAQRRQRERERLRRRARAKAEAQSRRDTSPEQREKEELTQSCKMARDLYESMRNKTSAAKTVKERQERRAMVDELRSDIRKHCR